MVRRVLLVALSAAFAGSALAAPPMVRPNMVVRKMAPPLAPEVRLKAFQSMMGSATPPAGTGTFTLSTLHPLEPGRGAVIFQNVVNSWPGDFAKTNKDYPLGYTQVRYKSWDDGSGFGYANLRLAAAKGQGFMIDCNLFESGSNGVNYSIATPDGGNSKSETQLASSGPLVDHLLIAVPKVAVAGDVNVAFHGVKNAPGTTENDLTVFGCDVTPY